MALSYDNIATTTLQLIRKRIADTIFKANPFTAWLLASGRVKTESGGKWIEEALMYGKNTTIGSYRGYDPLTVGPTEELTMARYNWRQAAGSISISGLEELQNDGEQAIFNLLQQKIKVAEMSFREWLNEKVLVATANKDLARDFLGLDEIIENVAGGSQGTLGGIDKSTYSWWQNQRDAQDLTGASSTNRLMYETLTTFVNTVGAQKYRPNLILTTQALYEHYEKENADLLRLSTAKDTRMLDVGFENQRFRGITMMWDEHVQANHFYVLNTDFINFTLHKRRNFVMTPFVKPHNQDARVAHMLLAGNMTANNCKHLGVIEFTNPIS